MQLNFQGRVREDIHMRQSQLVESMVRGARNDLLGQPFHLLTGLDILGNLSSVVGTLSKGAAALSMDKKFIRSRQRQVREAWRPKDFRALCWDVLAAMSLPGCYFEMLFDPL